MIATFKTCIFYLRWGALRWCRKICRVGALHPIVPFIIQLEITSLHLEKCPIIEIFKYLLWHSIVCTGAPLSRDQWMQLQDDLFLGYNQAPSSSLFNHQLYVISSDRSRCTQNKSNIDFLPMMRMKRLIDLIYRSSGKQLTDSVSVEKWQRILW